MSGWKMNDPVFEADEVNDKLRVAPWEGHRKFAYDLVRYMKPSNIVELGTHYGCSLFAFAQSIKDHHLDSSLYAVDTWSGDEQAGYYGEEVIETVSETVSRFFEGTDIRLIRKTFDEAVNHFEDGSVDLLHIDGLHTYEAVSGDYRTWLPKLKKDGVILFHDVFSPLEYGSNLFWKEIKEQFPNMELKHSWGLGILFPNGDRLYKKLLEENLPEKLLIYEYKALFELETIKGKDMAYMISERDKTIKSNEVMIRERDKTIESNEAMIRERDSAIIELIKEKELLQKAVDEQQSQLNYFRSRKIIFNFKKR